MEVKDLKLTKILQENQDLHRNIERMQKGQDLDKYKSEVT